MSKYIAELEAALKLERKEHDTLIVDLSKLEAALARERQMRCEHCGAKIVSYRESGGGCPRCGAPNCCPSCCAVTSAEAALRETKKNYSEVCKMWTDTTADLLYDEAILEVVRLQAKVVTLTEVVREIVADYNDRGVTQASINRASAILAQPKDAGKDGKQ